MKLFFSVIQILNSMLAHQSELQKQLIEAQQKIIELQQTIQNMTPKNPPDEEVFWHIASGMMSDEAANSENLATVRRFQQWNVVFAKKYVKPYVSPLVFGECLNQMTRGLSKQIGKLEARKAGYDERKNIEGNQPFVDSHLGNFN